MSYRILLKFLALTSFVTVGSIQPPLQAQPTGAAVLSQFATTYNGTYRTAGQRNRETGTFALRVEPNGQASATQRSSSGVITVFFGSANLATGAFSLNSASNGGAGTTVNGRLTVGMNAIAGTARFTRPDRTTGTISLSAPLVAVNTGPNPFADRYTGTSAITTGPGVGVATQATLIVNDDGSATATLYGQEGSVYNLVGAANVAGLFNLRSRPGGRATVTASGRLGANGGSGTFAIVNGPIAVRGTLTLTRRPEPAFSPFAGDYNGNLQITAGPGAGTTATLSLRVDTDGSAMATSRDAAGNSMTFTGSIGANGVLGLRGIVNGATYALSGRLGDNGAAITGTATYSSATGGRGSATLRQATTGSLATGDTTGSTGAGTPAGGTPATGQAAPATVAGNYSGTYRIALGDGTTETGTIGMNIAANGVATAVVRDANGAVTLYSGNADLTTGNFNLRATGGTTASLGGRITTDTGLSLGSGSITSAAGERASIVLSPAPVEAANPYTGSYSGTYRTTEGPDEGETGEFTLRVSSNGRATATAVSDDDLEDQYLMGDDFDDEDIENTFTGSVDLESGTFRLHLEDNGYSMTVIGRLQAAAGNPRLMTARGTYTDTEDNSGTVTLTKD